VTFVASGSFGAVVDHPIGWVVVQTGPKTATIDARFRNGGHDSMQPVHRWAILAAPLRTSTRYDGAGPTMTVVARDADGKKIAELSVDANTPYPGPPPPCEAGLPVKFPKSTGHVPADEPAARAAVTVVLQAAYGGAGRGSALAFVEGGASLAEVVQVASDRYPQYAGSIHPRIEEIRFVDTDKAAVRFGLDVTDATGATTPLLSPAIGSVVLRNGQWLVSRSTFCSLLAAGGVYCPLPAKGTKTT
jgi:hypothetical protein